MAKRNEISTTINEWDRLIAKERVRQGARGTNTRVTLSVKSQSVTVVTDPRLLGGPVADAIRDTLAHQIRSITAPASEDTLLFRVYAAGAYRRGKRWARKRYSGGRIGGMAPNSATGGRLFNDSGRLSKGLAVRPNSKGEWVINVPVNRLKRADFKPGRYDLMINKLVTLVPGLRDPRSLYQIPIVKESLDAAVSNMAIVAERAGQRSAEQLARALGRTYDELGQLGDATGELSEEDDD